MSDNPQKAKIFKIIREQINLPSPPAIAIQILNAVRHEDSLNDLALIISADPALTGKMLKIANSGFYSLAGKVTSVERAISLLGTNVVKNIALSFVIADEFHERNGSAFDYNYFWRRSITSAVAADLLSKALNINNDDLFVTALLHDLGVLLIYLSKREDYTELIKERRTTGVALFELEKAKYGFTHQEVGSILMADWGLPESISVPIRFHHVTGSTPEEHRRPAEILWCADLLSAIYSEAEKVDKVTQLQEEMIELFDLEAEPIRTLLDEVALKSITVLGLFDIDPADIKPYSQLLLEANSELAKLNFSYEEVVLNLKESKEKSERLTKELQDSNTKLKELVYRDGLTGLYNHRHFHEQLGREISRAQRYRSSVSLLMCDLDAFKQVNDTYGHPIGDLVLMNIARVIESTVRPNDVVARYGGEEFAIILPETNQEGMKIFAERLRRNIEGLATLADNQQINVTISIGGTTLTADNPTISKLMLIDTADQALYCSKANGRNQVTVKSPTPPGGKQLNLPT